MFARNVWIQNVFSTSITTKHNSDTKYFNVKHNVKLTVKTFFQILNCFYCICQLLLVYKKITHIFYLFFIFSDYKINFVFYTFHFFL